MKSKHLIFALPLFLALLLITLLAAFQVAGADWQTYTSEPGNFVVSAPGKMQESVSTTETPLGSIDTHNFVLRSGTCVYSIAYTDFPVPGTARANPLGALEGAVIRTLESHGTKLVSKKDIALDYALGIEFRGLVPDGMDFPDGGVVYGRVYLYDARVYQLAVIAPHDYPAKAEQERFLASFQWLNRDTLPDKVAR